MKRSGAKRHSVVMDSRSVTGRRHKLRANSCGHSHTALNKEPRSMGRANSLLRIHRLSGWVQAESEPVSAAFNATCMCQGIWPRSQREASCQEIIEQPAAQEKFVLDIPFHRTPHFEWGVRHGSQTGTVSTVYAANANTVKTVKEANSRLLGHLKN